MSLGPRLRRLEVRKACTCRRCRKVRRERYRAGKRAKQVQEEGQLKTSREIGREGVKIPLVSFSSSFLDSCTEIEVGRSAVKCSECSNRCVKVSGGVEERPTKRAKERYGIEYGIWDMGYGIFPLQG